MRSGGPDIGFLTICSNNNNNNNNNNNTSSHRPLLFPITGTEFLLPHTCDAPTALRNTFDAHFLLQFFANIKNLQSSDADMSACSTWSVFACRPVSVIDILWLGRPSSLPLAPSSHCRLWLIFFGIGILWWVIFG